MNEDEKNDLRVWTKAFALRIIRLRRRLQTHGTSSLRAERSNLCLKKRLLRRLRLLAMTWTSRFADTLLAAERTGLIRLAAPWSVGLPHRRPSPPGGLNPVELNRCPLPGGRMGILASLGEPANHFP